MTRPRKPASFRIEEVEVVEAELGVDADGTIRGIRARVLADIGAYSIYPWTAGIEALTSARTEADFERAEIAIARARLEDLEVLARTRYVSPLDLARLQAQIGEREAAFASLALAVTERSPGLVHLKLDRAFDRIRADQRFAAVVRQVGIP